MGARCAYWLFGRKHTKFAIFYIFLFSTNYSFLTKALLFSPAASTTKSLAFVYFSGSLYELNCTACSPRLSSISHHQVALALLRFAGVQRMQPTMSFMRRVIWYHWTCPGTFRQFTRAVFKWICGQGWTFDFPTAKEAGASEGTPCAPVQPSTPATPDNW